ncbi:MAG TPA: zf-HC2 domain-containing protein [Bryobacteraceae bacterium]|nr:zf-HC2 domain-containing protein [Bryobacteraceae bacterium]
MEFINNHPSEEVLEQYLFGALPTREIEGLEEHLLVCHSCIASAEQILAFVQSLRSTLRDKPKVRRASSTVVDH